MKLFLTIFLLLLTFGTKAQTDMGASLHIGFSRIEKTYENTPRSVEPSFMPALATALYIQKHVEHGPYYGLEVMFNQLEGKSFRITRVSAAYNPSSYYYEKMLEYTHLTYASVSPFAGVAVKRFRAYLAFQPSVLLYGKIKTVNRDTDAKFLSRYNKGEQLFTTGIRLGMIYEFGSRAGLTYHYFFTSPSSSDWEIDQHLLGVRYRF